MNKHEEKTIVELIEQAQYYLENTGNRISSLSSSSPEIEEICKALRGLNATLTFLTNSSPFVEEYITYKEDKYLV